MSVFLALLRRELGVYFVSPLAYIILTVLLGLSGLFFAYGMQEFASSRLPLDYRPTLQMVMIIVVLSSALVTMRLVAEEKARGTFETLLTAPVSDAQLVLAKYIAALILLAYLVVFTVGFAVIARRYGHVDVGAVACGYFGILLVGGVMYAIGLFISALCTSQITAGVLTFAASFVLLIASILGAFLPETSPWRPFLQGLDLNVNFGDFLKGVVDSSKLVYLLSVTGFFLFLTTRVVESRRWR